MTKLIMIAGFLGMLMPNLASAQSGSARQLIEESQVTHRKVRASAENLSRREVNQISRRLQAIQEIINGTFSGGGQQPGPTYGPEASTTLYSISRRSGGQTYTIRLSQPTLLEAVQISSRDGDVKVYSAIAITRRGSNQQLNGLESYRDYVYDREARVGGRNLVTEIQITAESFGRRASLDINVEAKDGERSFTLN